MTTSPYPRGIPSPMHEQMDRFKPPEDMHPSDPEMMVYRAYGEFARSMADWLPNGDLLIVAVDDLHKAMESALIAMRGD